MFDWLSRIISAIVETVTEVVDDVINAVGEFIADTIETVGNAIGDLFNVLDSLLPGSTGSIFSWLGNITSSIFSFAGALVKAALNIVGNVITGVIRIIIGVMAFNLELILEGFQDFTEIVGNTIVVLGKAWEVIQAIVIVTQRRRRLTPAEAAMLERIYQGSLALYNIRIIDTNAGVFGLNDFPFVLGNVVYLRGRNVDPDDPAAEEHILVHESVHVWQYQVEGGSYLSNALGGAVLYQETNKWHGWRVDLEVNNNIRFRDFNKEAQGYFIMDIYIYGELLPGNPPAVDNGVFFDADNDTTFGQLSGSFPHASLDNVEQDYTGIAQDAVDYIRGKINVRLSKFLPL